MNNSELRLSPEVLLPQTSAVLRRQTKDNQLSLFNYSYKPFPQFNQQIEEGEEETTKEPIASSTFVLPKTAKKRKREEIQDEDDEDSS